MHQEEKFLKDYQSLNTLQEGRLLSWSQQLPQAIPMIKYQDDLTLGINAEEIQKLANKLEADKLRGADLEEFQKLMADE